MSFTVLHPSESMNLTEGDHTAVLFISILNITFRYGKECRDTKVLDCKCTHHISVYYCFLHYICRLFFLLCYMTHEAPSEGIAGPSGVYNHIEGVCWSRKYQIFKKQQGTILAFLDNSEFGPK